ncbi:MAG: hypothetical protein H5U00_08445 [Clostridia bacterium]|nr:hypothetical protein [Clostridia bacterium]
MSSLELEVARLIRFGFGRRAVAAALGVSPGTVKAVQREVRRKLGPGWENNAEYVWPDEDEAWGALSEQRARASGGDVTRPEPAGSAAAWALNGGKIGAYRAAALLVEAGAGRSGGRRGGEAPGLPPRRRLCPAVAPDCLPSGPRILRSICG